MNSKHNRVMHVLLLMILALCIAGPAIGSAQTRNEMQDEMKQMVDEAKREIADKEEEIADARKSKEDPETINELEVELGQLKKELSTMEGMVKGVASIKISDEALTAYEDARSGALPKRDQARISMLPKAILSDAELIVFVTQIQNEVERIIPVGEKAQAAELLNAVKTKYSSPLDLGNIASTLWMNGHQESALYIIGRTCSMNMDNGNNLNNYAAFLSMAGGEHAAIPILLNLNTKFPNNSTILNNIGQAWLGLGDIDNAKKHLNMAVAVYANHAQANNSLSDIYKAEGKTAEAITCLKKSIDEVFTVEKTHKLNDLGGKMEAKDFRNRYPVPKGPFGMHKFQLPEYPNSADNAVVREEEWKNFQLQLSATVGKLNNQIATIKADVEKFNKAILNPNSPEAKLAAQIIGSPVYTKIHEEFLTGGPTDNSLRLGNKMDAAKKNAKSAVKILRDQYEIKALEIPKKYANCRGEGDPCFPEMCADQRRAYSDFLNEANKIWENANIEIRELADRRLEESVYYGMYLSIGQINWEKTKLDIKKGYLMDFVGGHEEGRESCIPPKKENKPGRKPLPDFDEVNCRYKSEVFVPPFTTIKVECNRMSTFFDIDTKFGPKIRAGMEENLATRKFTKGTLEIGAGVKLSGVKLGPLAAEMKAEGAAGIEITPNGQSIYVKAAVKSEISLDATSDLPDNPSMGGGMEAEVRMSWNAGQKGSEGTIGTSLSGQGSLSDIRISMPH